MKKLKKALEPVIATLFALTLWHILSVVVANDIVIVSPITVLIRIATIWREPGFFTSVLFSFSRIAMGFTAAVVLGVILAVTASKVHVIEVMLKPIMSAIKAVPVASIIIIVLVWLDSASLSAFISFLIVLPVVYTNLLSGLTSIPKGLSEMAKVFGVTGARRLIYISLPCLKPYIMSTVGVVVGLAFKSGIAAEVIGIPTGSIGERLYQAKIYLETPDMLAWTVITVLLSVLLEKLSVYLVKCLYRRLER